MSRPTQELPKIVARVRSYRGAPTIFVNGRPIHGGFVGTRGGSHFLGARPEGVVPLTWGYFRPTVLLPDSIETWDSKRKRIVLLHELAHIQRGDSLSSFMIQLATVLFCYNPLVWAAVRHFYIEREHASDNIVLTTGTKASDYAHHLLEIARTLTTIRWTSPVEVAMAQKSNLIFPGGDG